MTDYPQAVPGFPPALVQLIGAVEMGLDLSLETGAEAITATGCLYPSNVVKARPHLRTSRSQRRHQGPRQEAWPLHSDSAQNRLIICSLAAVKLNLIRVTLRAISSISEPIYFAHAAAGTSSVLVFMIWSLTPHVCWRVFQMDESSRTGAAPRSSDLLTCNLIRKLREKFSKSPACIHFTRSRWA